MEEGGGGEGRRAVNLFLSDSIVIILNSWREGSRNQCRGYLKRWVQICSERKVDLARAAIASALDILTDLYNKNGLGYSTLNTARSALSSIWISTKFVSFGLLPLVAPFIRGMYDSRPSLPQYTKIWDLLIALEKLKKNCRESHHCI